MDLAGQIGRRGNLQYTARGRKRGVQLSAEEARGLLTQLAVQLDAARPAIDLIAIHRFKRPGRELLWQRHGIATASAALLGGLAVGASHFTKALPQQIDQSPLAAFAVPTAHLSLGCHRPAREHMPRDGFEVALPWDPRARALVRLFEASPPQL